MDPHIADPPAEPLEQAVRGYDCLSVHLEACQVLIGEVAHQHVSLPAGKRLAAVERHTRRREAAVVAFLPPVDRVDRVRILRPEHADLRAVAVVATVGSDRPAVVRPGCRTADERVVPGDAPVVVQADRLAVVALQILGRMVFLEMVRRLPVSGGYIEISVDVEHHAPAVVVSAIVRRCDEQLLETVQCAGFAVQPAPAPVLPAAAPARSADMHRERDQPLRGVVRRHDDRR